MTVQSMTGFGRGEAQNDEYHVTVEIKSVNNRYKDFRFKMSGAFNSFETNFKSELKERFQRGSFDIYINFKRSAVNSKVNDIDLDKVKSFIELFKDQNVQFNATDFLRQEFAREEDNKINDELCHLGLEALKLAADDLLEARCMEGAKLKLAIEKHLANYSQHFQEVKPLTATLKDGVKEKLLKRFQEFDDLKIDEPRFMQEVVYYLEKLDVEEEIDRIESHLAKLKGLLNDKQEVGRQIDFLVQELNRETNTIGSKSSLEELSNLVVQMKVNLEKVREQGLNLQ